MSDLVHLHVHSQYSLLDGLCSPEELVQAAKDIGHTSIAITDHGTLSGHRGLQRAAASAGIKPILGVEAYISGTDRFDRRTKARREEGDQVYNHIVLLAKDQQGVKNLQALSNIAWNEGYYHKPRIDYEVLSEYGDGLIVLSGCLNGLISKAIERGDEEAAHMWMKAFKDRFDQDFYVEVQSHNPLEINNGLLELADYYSVGPVITSDCHYAREDQRAIEEAFLILSTNPKKADEVTIEGARDKRDLLEKFNYLYPERKMTFQEWNLFVEERSSLKSQMAAQEIERDDIYENTVKIADSIGEYEYFENLDLLPRPVGDPNVELRTMAEAGLKRKGLGNSQPHIDRLNEELRVITSKDFSPYFIVVADAVDYAHKKGIRVGPGRGSAAGSLLCYVLGITAFDPLEYGLLFSRFINEERNDWPDIDIDFEATRRGEMKAYMAEKYPSVGNIATFSYFKDKGTIKDAARALSIPIKETEEALKQIPAEGGFEAFETSPLTEDYRRKYPEVLDLAKNLRGRIRGTGLHAAAIVVSSKPLEDYMPIESRTDNSSKDKTRLPVIAYDMEEVANIGAIKIDFLGLNNLSMIEDCLDMVERNHGKRIDLGYEFDDPKVYQSLSNGFTAGVFQCEQPAYTKLLKDMGVSDFNDLAVSNALVRPGAANTVGADYISRKHGRSQVEPVHPIYDEITKDTYGLVIYQEQVMLLCVDLAGMSWSEADKVRKIIGKKKDVSEFNQYQERFVTGASRYVDASVAEKLWHDFEAHADYSFNKSHAVAYSAISYWTAWLKHYYPVEFLAAVLRHQGDVKDYTPYFVEAKRLGIKVALPHINTSPIDFDAIDGKIHYGLGRVKYMSDVSATILINNRPFQSYSDFTDLVELRGSGITNMHSKSLNSIGAILLPDNPLTGEERDNFYGSLGLPSFDMSAVTDEMLSRVMKSDRWEEKGIGIFIGMAKKITRKNNWCRAEFVDETGTFSGFTSPSTQIKEGSMYLVMMSDNSVSRYIALEELAELSDDPLVSFLNGKVAVEDKQYYVLSFNARRSKRGTDYAELIILNSRGDARKVMAFGKMFPHALGKGKPGRVVRLSVAPMDDGTLMLKGIEPVEVD